MLFCLEIFFIVSNIHIEANAFLLTLDLVFETFATFRLDVFLRGNCSEAGAGGRSGGSWYPCFVLVVFFLCVFP